MKADYPYATKNQREARKKPIVPKPPLGFWMSELVLYGIRLLAKQLLGTVLDMEVDQSGSIITEWHVGDTHELREDTHSI